MGVGSVNEVMKTHKAFFVEIRKILKTPDKGLTASHAAALHNLQYIFGDLIQRQQDAREFADNICEICGLNRAENTVFRHQRFELHQESKSLNVSQVQSDATVNCSYFVVDPNGKTLSENLSLEVLADAESFIDITKGEQKKTKDATMFSSLSCESFEHLESIRVVAAIFRPGDRRDAAGGRALLSDDDDCIKLTLRKKIEFDKGSKDSYTEPDIEIIEANFKINTVVFHVGGMKVNSGHYVTMENLGDRYWLIHNNNLVSVFEGCLKQFVLLNPAAVPYLVNLVKVQFPS